MSNDLTIVLFLAAAAVLLAGWALYQLHRTRRLQSKFGPEFNRLIDEQGSARRAAEVLRKRERRVAEFRTRPLSHEERERFAAEWRWLQEHFVDDPPDAVAQAAVVVDRGLRARGYPLADFEQQAADLSVEYAQVVDHYRRAHEIALSAQRGLATTEDLRRAMQHYRNVFERLLEMQIVEPHQHEMVRR